MPHQMSDRRLFETLLSRVYLDISLDRLLRQVAIEYGLKKLISYEPIGVGYEELNIKIVVEKGIYVVKIFSKGKNPDVIQDYIKGLVEFYHAGIPVPKLLRRKDEYLFRFSGRKGSTYLCVMEYFNGQSFLEREPTENDLINLTKYIAKIHSLNFKINSNNYDSWGTSNLLAEYDKKKYCLRADDLQIIQPVVIEFQNIDFSNFRQSVIHGDLQRNNIMKSSKGDYCILDLGSLNFAPSAIDLAIFLAVFCFDPYSVVENKRRYKLVVNEYTMRMPLSPLELLHLPTLIKATYAIYFISSNYALQVNNDDSSQTVKWLDYSRRGLEMLTENMALK